MAPRVFAATVRALCSARTLNHGLQRSQLPSQNADFDCLSKRRPFSSEGISNSPFDANILRILNKRIEMESEYPVSQAATAFHSLTVQDRPGLQWVTMRGKFGDGEDIKIEATSFDAAVVVRMPDEDRSGQDLRLHISLLVSISKKGGGALEFVCSAWPDSLSIENVYIFQHDKIRSMPYIGPNFRKLNEKMQKAFQDFLEAREINSELAAFLHEYMINKERSESIRWLQSLRAFYEK